MMDNQFLDAISACSITDLEFMLNVDADSYSGEELTLIEDVLAQKQTSLKQQRKLSGDVLFCCLAFGIYLISSIAVWLSGISCFSYVGLLFGIVIRFCHFRIGKRIVSDDTFYSMMTLLYPVIGVMRSIWLLIQIPHRFRKCFMITIVSVLLRMFLYMGGVQF